MFSCLFWSCRASGFCCLSLAPLALCAAYAELAAHVIVTAWILSALVVVLWAGWVGLVLWMMWVVNGDGHATLNLIGVPAAGQTWHEVFTNSVNISTLSDTRLRWAQTCRS